MTDAPRQTPTPDSTHDETAGTSRWQVTLWAMVGIQFIMTMSFSFLSPIMPLFLPELGVHTEAGIDLWSGILNGSTSFVAAFTSPLWGRLADRYGRKPMLIRSSCAIAVFTAFMGLSQTVWQFFAARALMGVFAGFSSTAMALVASQVPEQRLGYALGWLSSGQLVGSLVGPVIGGMLADITHSYRIPFYCTSAVTFAAVFLVWRGVHERFVRPGAHRRRSGIRGLALMIGAAGVLPLFFVLFMAQFGTRAVQPLVTVFVQELLGPRPDLATLGGLAFSVTGLAGMVAVPLLGKHSDEIGYRRVLLICLVGATLTSLPQAFVGSYWVFVVERFGVGAVHRRHRADSECADRPHGGPRQPRHGVWHDRLGDIPRQFAGPADRRRDRRLVRLALGVPDHRGPAAGEPDLGIFDRAGTERSERALTGTLSSVQLSP